MIVQVHCNGDLEIKKFFSWNKFLTHNFVSRILMSGHYRNLHL